MEGAYDSEMASEPYKLSLVEIDEKPTIYRSCGPYVPLSR